MGKTSRGKPLWKALQVCRSYMGKTSRGGTFMEGPANYLPKYNKFSTLELESSTSRNIRNILRVGSFHCLSTESYLLKYNRSIRLKSSISRNIRKFHCARVLNMPFPKYEKSSVTPGFWIYLSWNIRKFLKIRGLFLRKYKAFLGKNFEPGPKS